MKVAIVLLFVALVAFASAEPDRNCPENKEYGSFGDCPPSCYNINNEDRRPCTMKLNWGCKCATGYVLLNDRDFSSVCVRPEDCP